MPHENLKATNITTDNRRFFKYMNRQTARSVLEKGTLRWSTPGTLNDPYDMQFDLHVDIDRPLVKSVALQKLWDAHYGDKPAPAKNDLGKVIQALRGTFPKLTREEFDQEFGEAIDEALTAMERSLPEMQATFRAELAKSKILCLTVKFDSALMWTHYAEQHQGLLLRFRSVAGLDSPWVTARPVQYLTDMPRLMSNSFLADLLAGRASMDAKSIMDRMVYTKAREWEYEQEWRIFSGSGRDPEALFEFVPFNPLELDAVIVGYRMPPEDRAVFSDLCRKNYPHAERLQIERSERQFQLTMVPLAT